MPAWFTLNMRASYAITEKILFQLAAENLLDRNYRVFASGFSAPGRNFVITLRLRH
jgi:hemoglobin/transferrin/lactoferrin receptor protein